MSDDQWFADLKHFVKEDKSCEGANPEDVAKLIKAVIDKKDTNSEECKARLVENLDFFMTAPEETKGFVDRLVTKLGQSGRSSRNTFDRSSPSPKHAASPRYADFSDDDDEDDRNFKHRRRQYEGRFDYSEQRPKRHMQDDDYSRRHSRNHDQGRDGYSNSIPNYPAAMQNDSRYRGENRRDGNYRKKPCRSYHERGFCDRPGRCPYDHGADPLIVGEGFSMPPAAFTLPNQYDAPMFGQPNGYRNMPPPMRGGPSFRSRDRGRGGHQSFRNLQFSTLKIQNIPHENCKLSDVEEHFKKFGNITSINIDPEQQQATLRFENPNHAKEAYQSPDPVFGNRFIRVSYVKDRNDANSTTDPAPRSAVPPPKVEPQRPTNEPDPEVVAARAAEIAKVNAIKQAKRQESLKAVLDLQKQREQQLQRQIEEQKQLMEKLADTKGMSKEEKEKLTADIKSSNANIKQLQSAAQEQPDQPSIQPQPTSQEPPTSEETKPRETVEELKKKLAKLEAEAMTLGISTETFKSQAPGFRGGRGGYYGRGRGWPRARGGSVPRFSIDNRPKSLLLTGIPTEGADDVRKHYEQFGPIEGWDASKENGVVATYTKRFDAEKAMAHGFPKLDVTWYTSPASTTEQPQTEVPVQPQEPTE